jgi:hypothetical protein
MRITIATLRRIAPIGVTVEHEERPLGGTYVATAPDGQRFNDGPHQLVAVWGGRYDAGSPADARRDLFERLTETALEACSVPNCSTCIEVE